VTRDSRGGKYTALTQRSQNAGPEEMAQDLSSPTSDDDLEAANVNHVDSIIFEEWEWSHRFVRSVGKHEPVYGGMCLAPDLGCCTNLIWVSFSLIFFPTILWFVRVAPKFWSDMSPAGVIFVLSTFVTCQTFLLLARYTEPGLLPTCAKKNPDHEGLTDAQMKKMKVRREYFIVIGGQQFELPELRAKFCAQTDNCIEKFDHYCPWVGNSVGIRNYRFFVGFVTTTTIHSLVVCITSLVFITHDSGDFIERLRSHPSAFLLVVYTIIISLCVGGLAFYHWNIISKNITTNEDLKDSWARKRNPYNQGFCKNAAEILCSPIRASYIREGAEDLLAGSSLATVAATAWTDAADLSQEARLAPPSQESAT